jgi:uncharacterized protein
MPRLSATGRRQMNRAGVPCMLIVLSPAKTLDFESPILDVEASRPEFSADAARLVTCLRELPPARIAALMSLSDRLASLNAERYANYSARGKPAVARQALLAFDGDVYAGLDARNLPEQALHFAQRHLRILSGLYGVLRPLDLIQPYRLEMGTRLQTARGGDLYAYWGSRPAKALKRALDGHDTAVLVNLASEEYFKAIDRRALGVPVIQPIFQERREGAFRIIGFSAKRARGMMARFAIDHRLTDPEGLKAFDRDGYGFDRKASTEQNWYFRRAA